VSGPVIVSSVRARRAKPEPAAKPVPREPQRAANWPFPSSDPAARHAMALEHQAQQRATVVNGPGALL
jgi:hypothetical protein